MVVGRSAAQDLGHRARRSAERPTNGKPATVTTPSRPEDEIESAESDPAAEDLESEHEPEHDKHPGKDGYRPL